MVEKLVPNALGIFSSDFVSEFSKFHNENMRRAEKNNVFFIDSWSF